MFSLAVCTLGVSGIFIEESAEQWTKSDKAACCNTDASLNDGPDRDLPGGV